MTTDPRTLIAETIHTQGVCEGDDPAGCGNTCRRHADLILEALTAAGYRLILPARTIHGVQLDGDTVFEIAAGLRGGAPEVVQRWGGQMLQAVVGPWEPAPVCGHESADGDEGPIAKLGRWPTRWRCNGCGEVFNDETPNRKESSHGNVQPEAREERQRTGGPTASLSRPD